jgi:hypothetical protein
VPIRVRLRHGAGRVSQEVQWSVSTVTAVQSRSQCEVANGPRLANSARGPESLGSVRRCIRRLLGGWGVGCLMGGRCRKMRKRGDVNVFLVAG